VRSPCALALLRRAPRDVGSRRTPSGCPFEELVRDCGLRYVELGTERCNASFREIMDAPLAA
jgi:hypothetical protein